MMKWPGESFNDLIPELKDLPKEQYLKSWRKYYIKSFLHWASWLGYVGFAGCLSLWDRAVSHFSGFLSVEWRPVFEIFSLIVFGTLGWLIYFLLVIHAINLEIHKQKK